jgi:hypothetical protein
MSSPKFQDATANLIEAFSDNLAASVQGVSLADTVRCLSFIDRGLESYLLTRRLFRVKQQVRSRQLWLNLEAAFKPGMAHYFLMASKLTNYDSVDNWPTYFLNLAAHIKHDDILSGLKSSAAFQKPRRAILMLEAKRELVSAQTVSEVGRIMTHDLTVSLLQKYSTMLNSVQDFYDTAEFSKAYANLYSIITERSLAEAIQPFLSKLSAKLESLK